MVSNTKMMKDIQQFRGAYPVQGAISKSFKIDDMFLICRDF